MDEQSAAVPSWEIASNKGEHILLGNTNVAGITWPKSYPDPVWVGNYTQWLVCNEPGIVREYGQALVQGDTRTLEEWVDAMYPYMYEIWGIVRYRDDV